MLGNLCGMADKTLIYIYFFWDLFGAKHLIIAICYIKMSDI